MFSKAKNCLWNKSVLSSRKFAATTKKAASSSKAAPIHKAILRPTNSPIFPFRSWTGELKKDDIEVLQSLQVKEVAAFYTKSDDLMYKSEQKVMKELLAEAKERSEVLIKQSEEDVSSKPSIKKGSTLPVKFNYTKKENLLGQGLAQTIDEETKAFDLPKESLTPQVKSSFSEKNSLKKIFKTGSLCNIRLYPVNSSDPSRKVMNIEGKETIELVKGLSENELFKFLEKVREDKIKELAGHLEKIPSIEGNSQFENSSVLKTQLDELSKRKMDKQKVLEDASLANIQLVEYRFPIRDDQGFESHILDSVLKDVWKAFDELDRKTSMTFRKMSMMSENDQLDLLCAYATKIGSISNPMLQLLMQIPNHLERALVLLKLVDQAKEKYIEKWSTLKNDNSTQPQSSKEAKEQIDDLYNYIKKFQEDSFSPMKKTLIKKVKKSLETKKYSDEMKSIIIEELEKLHQINENHHEFGLLKEYLDLICDLPYGVESEDNYDLKNARDILDDDHYGIDKVKDKILEFIAVSKLRKSTKGKNILLVGPPGTGKTSIASSIAKCLNREFVRISLGGESDSAIIKGHRKTYIGAYPGKLVMALKQAKTENPVILIDEVDKTAVSHRGNIQDTLLEVLDPAQNHSFKDNYLEAPLDLSKVLFICSANMLNTLSPPLLDRLEVVEMSGYTADEKKEIANKHLIPKGLEKKGLKEYKVEIPEETLTTLIDRYAREAGVRSLEKRISRILEKVCLKIVENGEKDFKILPEELKKYVGPPIFSSERYYPESLPKGVCIGLSYSSIGGGILYVETSKSSFPKANSDKGSSVTVTVVENTENPIPEDSPNDKTNDKPNIGGVINSTGQLGKVMEESIQIAHTFAKFFCHEAFGNKFLEENNVHIHFPEGACKKDGPSAGITITSALVSLALGKPIRGDVALTGEISLNGKILKIGGLKEKVLAAKREGIFRVIVPKANQPDVEEMPQEIKQGVTFIFVTEYEQVCKVLLGTAGNIWTEDATMGIEEILEGVKQVSGVGDIRGEQGRPPLGA